MSELKPCPFCGSNCVNDTTGPSDQNDEVGYFWTCPDCVCSGPFEESIEKATEGWNLRAIPEGYALVPVDVLQCARDNAQELLTWHLDALGETTSKNASQAQQYRDELAKLNQLIDKAGVLGL